VGGYTKIITSLDPSSRREGKKLKKLMAIALCLMPIN
jgi:hypothetical protein